MMMVGQGCNPAPSAEPPTGTPSVERAASEGPANEAPSAPAPPVGEAPLPIPDAVAKLHEKALEAPADGKLARAICVVTVHDAPLKRGSFFPVVLLADGSVATWRQTPAGREEPFFAELSAEERARAGELVEAISVERTHARLSFDASAVVMGVSTRVGEQRVTLFFPTDRVPAPLSELVGLLKGRLEATNRAP
jgi:hypothetical protein